METLYAMNYTLFNFDGIWKQVLGSPERNGAWLVWGSEKNGKTWLTLLLANYLSEFEKLLYISAEEGLGNDFKQSCIRAKISPMNKRLVPSYYIAMPELYQVLKGRRAPRIVVVDNITVYNEELKNGAFRKLLLDFPNVLFIFLAHEDRGQPYTATAKLCMRLAKVIFNITGLACKVSGRCPGGTLVIDEDRATLVNGQQILNKVS